MPGERHFKQRFFDGRSAVGRRVKTIINGVVKELGGAAVITASQWLILDALAEKIGASYAITEHIEKAAALVGEDGLLIPALRRSHLGYNNSIRRDLEVLFQLRDRPAKKGVDLAAYVKAKRGAQA